MLRHPWLRRLVFAAGLLLVATVFAPLCHAQSGDSDDLEDSLEDTENSQPSASLSIMLDRDGNADVAFWMDQKPPSWEPIRNALSTGLRCPAANLANPPAPARQALYLNRLNAEQRTRYLESIEGVRMRQLQGHCPGAWTVSGSVVSGTFDYGDLLQALRPLGVEVLWVRLPHPATPLNEYSRTYFNRDAQWQRAQQSITAYQIPVKEASRGAITLAYGFDRSTLKRLGALLAGFVLLPVALTLWMRRTALKMGKDDPIAANFAYFRAVKWFTTGAMLLWMLTRINPREGLEQLLAFAAHGRAAEEAFGSVLLLIGPPLLIYVICTGLSYPVLARLRASQWSRAEFFRESLLDLGMRVLPILLILAGVRTAQTSLVSACVLILGGAVCLVVCRQLKLKVNKSVPEVLSSGELRDRIAELAQRAGLKPPKVIVMPAGKGQVANAAAMKTNIVIFTDYLLKRLSKREVDTIAAHELSHLKYRHPVKLGMAIIAAVFLPWLFASLLTLFQSMIAVPIAMLPGASERGMMLWEKTILWIQASPYTDAVLLALGLTGFFFLARRFEREADSGALLLAGDPEAQITGLLKVHQLNLVPLHWSRASGALLTHPPTLKRVQRIAEQGAISPERLQAILERYQVEALAELERRRHPESATPETTDANDHYAIPDPSQRLMSPLVQAQKARLNLALAFVAHVVPPVLVAGAIEKLNLQIPVVAAFVLGFVLTLIPCLLLGIAAVPRGRAKLRRRFAQKLLAEGVPVAGNNAYLVGVSPGAWPRYYAFGWNWDTGFLLLEKGKLSFLGDQARFAVAAKQVVNVRLGQGAPSWWRLPRVYVEWRDEQGREGVFNLALVEPCSFWKLRKEACRLEQTLASWWKQSVAYPEPTSQLAELKPPALEKVNCKTPRALGSLGRNLKLFVYMCILSAGLCALWTIPDYAYCMIVIFLVRLALLIPYWIYRDAALPALPAPRLPVADARPQAVGVGQEAR